MNIEININALTNNIIYQINEAIKQGNTITLICKNTSKIKSKDILLLENPTKVNFRVLGGLDKEKYSDPRYMERVTYKSSELFRIIASFEKIESLLDISMTDKEKAIKVYDYLADHIRYKDYNSSSERNLNCIVTRYGVCAGYALVYKEIMDRLGIDCDYVRGKVPNLEGRHAWNVLKVDGEIIPVDLTWDSDSRSKTGNRRLKYFGVSDIFINNHLPEFGEEIQNYEDTKKLEQPKKEKRTIEINYYKRDDGSAFCLSKIREVNINGYLEYQYIEREISSNDFFEDGVNIVFSENDINMLDDQTKRIFINSICDKNRIKTNVENNGGYLGYVARDNKKYKNGNIISFLEGKTISKSYTRDDGTCFSVILGTDNKYNEEGIYNYDMYEIINNNDSLVVQQNNIYSENNLLISTAMDRDIATSLLSRSRVDEKQISQAGYVGFIGVDSFGKATKYINATITNNMTR